jgi:hypothetical protein
VKHLCIFCERYDATGRAGLTALQKCIAALRQLAYVIATDTIDEYMKLGKIIVLEYLEYYCLDIFECFGMSSYIILLSLILGFC